MNSPIQSSTEFDKYNNKNNIQNNMQNNVKFIDGSNIFSSIVTPFSGISLLSNVAILSININNLNLP